MTMPSSMMATEMTKRKKLTATRQLRGLPLKPPSSAVLRLTAFTTLLRLAVFLLPRAGADSDT
eukprot:7377536-Prymnesium_polylepis.2